MRLSTLASKKVQYLVIIWILVLEIIEIVSGILLQIESLRYLSILGFKNLTPVSELGWNLVVLGAFLWLIYRLFKDVFQIPAVSLHLSKGGILGAVLLATCCVSLIVVALQLSMLATFPLAHPTLQVSKSLMPSKDGEDSMTLRLADVEESRITLDLSRSAFDDPFSFCSNGETSYGNTRVAESYFSLKNTSIGQRLMEMRYSGIGDSNLQGWFAYKIPLQTPLKIGNDSFLLLLLKLTASRDHTAWTYIRLDFTTEGEAYVLTWKFHDVPMDYVFKSHNRTRNNYLLGSTTEWQFYQFDLTALYYASFSRFPQYITSVEYGVGANASKEEITAQYLLAKISKSPLEINENRIQAVKTGINLNPDGSLRTKGPLFNSLDLVLTPKAAREETVFQFSMLDVSRIESYRWNIANSEGQVETSILLDIVSNSTALNLNGQGIGFATPTQKPTMIKVDDKVDELILEVRNEIPAFMIPVALSSSILTLVYFLFAGKREREHYI